MKEGGEEESVSNAGQDVPSISNSNAERLRQRRREKILANQTSRIQRITSSGLDKDSASASGEGVDAFGLGDSAKMAGSSSSSGSVSSKRRFSPPPRILVDEADGDDPVHIYRRRQTATAEEIHDSISKEPLNSNIDEAEDFMDSTGSIPMGFFNPRADGSTIHPKIPAWVCRILVCILGVILTVFNARYLMVTFFSWELAVLFVNGLPAEESPSSVLILLIALMGLKEPHLKRLKFALKLSNCLITDISLFIVFALLPRIVF